MQSTQVDWLNHSPISQPPRQTLDHHACPGRTLGIIGAFDIWLTPFQIDDLWKLGYTRSDETCLYCHQETTLVLHLIPDTIKDLR